MPARVAAPPAGAPNVILVMVDTLRADHLGAYGYASAKTPSIDGLAADGVRAAHTFSQASWTRPSVATILTGLYPSSHGAVHKADILPDRVDTLAEVLSRGGYNTVGFADNVNVSPSFNFGQGFADYRYLAPDLFFHANEPAAQLTLYNGLRLVRERFLARRVDVHNYYQPAEVVTDTVIAWLDSPAVLRASLRRRGICPGGESQPAAGRGREVSRSLRRRDRVPRHPSRPPVRGAEAPRLVRPHADRAHG
jgi:hypothetical protein